MHATKPLTAIKVLNWDWNAIEFSSNQTRIEHIKQSLERKKGGANKKPGL